MRTLIEIHGDYALLSSYPEGAAAYLTIPLLGVAAALGFAWGNSYLATALVGLPVLVALSFIRPKRVRVSLEAKAKLRLEALNESEDPGFRVVLLQSGREDTLLEHPSLAVVLRDLERILEATPLVLQDGVVPAAYLRRVDPVVPATREPTTALGHASGSQRRAAHAVLGAALFLGLVFAWSLVKRESELAVLSAALPSAAIAFLAGLAGWLACERTQVRVSSTGVEVEKHCFGWRRPVLSIPAQELAGAHVVEQADIAIQVVFATRRGPRAIPLLGDPARRVAQAVGELTSASTPDSGAGDAQARSSTLARNSRERRVPREVAGRVEIRKNA